MMPVARYDLQAKVLLNQTYNLLLRNKSKGGSEIHFFTGNHGTMLRELYLRVVAERMKPCLEKAQATELQRETS